MVTKVKTMAWEKPLLIIFLFVIHLISDVIVYVGLCWNLFRKVLTRRFSNNIRNDFQAVQDHCTKFSKTPDHIAFAFLETSISIKDVAHLVLWTIATGAKGISLYDIDGFLKYHQDELKKQVTHLVKYLEYKPFYISWNSIDPNANDNFTVCLYSKEDGQEDIVQAARKLARHVANGNLKVDDVNESVIEENLGSAIKGLPDPEVLLRFGLAHSNQGYPPWQIRLSEIHDINSHYGVTCLDFLNILSKYSRCEKRFGR